MLIRGVIQSAELRELGEDQVEMDVRVQGVGPGQPRRLVVPFGLLVADPTLEPDTIAGHGFEAVLDEPTPGRWIASEFRVMPRRVLRSET